ncbi:MAG TPA: ROK family protein, partial [Polyangiaceae bacterium]|nr:ROK family protein [Polyangiaceae bacterium]
DADGTAFVGIHLGVRRTSLAVADALGHVLAMRSLGAYRSEADRALRELPDIVVAVAGEAGVPRARIGAIGVAVPGLVDAVTASCVLAPNLGWREVPLGPRLTDAFGVPVAVRNSMQAGGTAEVRLGGHRAATSFAWVYVEDGIGAAVVADGRVLYGKHGYAGEIGHWRRGEEGSACACGRRGCLETVASGAAIEAAAKAALSGGAQAGATPPALDAQDVAEAARSGDPAAQRVLARAAEHLGVAVSNSIDLLDPDRVVLDGPVVRASDFFVEAVRATVARRAINAPTVPIVRSVVGGDVMLKGAVLLAMDAIGAAPYPEQERPSTGDWLSRGP